MSAVMVSIIVVLLVRTVVDIMILDILLPSLLYIVQHFFFSFVLFLDAVVNFRITIFFFILQTKVIILRLIGFRFRVG
ncbi:hypothetical protein AAHC03_019360 [Spirometra sp. Aus1]